MNEYFKTILLSTILTIILLQCKNKSNFNSIYIIPIIVSLLVKYLIGDWDVGYQWTTSDIFYWTTLIFSSVFVIFIYKHSMIDTRQESNVEKSQ